MITETILGSLILFEKKFTIGLKMYAKIPAAINGVRIALSIYRNQTVKPINPKIKTVLSLIVMRSL